MAVAKNKPTSRDGILISLYSFFGTLTIEAKAGWHGKFGEAPVAGSFQSTFLKAAISSKLQTWSAIRQVINR
jgi:hypothetical protein